VHAQSITGINIGGLAVSAHERVGGISASGLVVTGIDVWGIAAAPLVGGSEQIRGAGVGAAVLAHRITGVAAGGVVGLWRMGPPEQDEDRLHGIAAAILTETTDLTGFSVAAWNQVRGVQRGVTIGLSNQAAELHGIQIGILNTAGNNRGMFRMLPIVNAHFGR
jgi:hypothetical protein